MPMKILISNKFYYNRGGDCVASIALEELLQQKGHDVAFFSMQHPLNFHSEWESFFPSNVDFQSNSWGKKIEAIKRLYFSEEVKSQFLKIINTFKPDIVHLNNIHSQISPLIGELAHQKGIKVIWTLHDYKLICPCYTCLNKNNVCNLCISSQNPFHVIENKCMKGSFLASVLAYIEALIWNKKRLIQNTDIFISPSSFLAKRMIDGGFPSDKLRILRNFTNREYPQQINTIKKDYFCYVGRLSQEKGLKTLLNATKQLPYKLIIIGTGPLANTFSESNSKIKFVGFKEWNEISTILQESRFMVIPSEWYENNPISVIESQCLGTPVLGANIGGIPEVIEEYKNGLLFESGNSDDLKEKIELMYHMPFDYTKISQEALKKYSAENYYRELIKIYNE